MQKHIISESLKNKRNRLAVLRAVTASAVIVLILLNVLFGFVSGKINLKIDLTKDSVLKLSDTTKTALKNLDTDTIKKFVDSSNGEGDNKFHLDLNDIIDTAKIGLSYIKGDASLTDKLTLLSKYNELKNTNIYKSLSEKIDSAKEVIDSIKADSKNNNTTPADKPGKNESNYKGGYGLLSRVVSNKRSEELDNKYNNIQKYHSTFVYVQQVQ